MRKIVEVDCEVATINLVAGNPEVVLLHPGAVDAGDQVVPVGLVVDGGLEVYPSAARRVVFGPRVLRLIAVAIDGYMAGAPFKSSKGGVS